MFKSTKRALRRALTHRAQQHKLWADRQGHTKPPHDWEAETHEEYYGNSQRWRFMNDPLRPYVYVCDCFWNKRLIGKARKTAIHAGYTKGCRQAYDREYWGGERLRVRVELINWSEDSDSPAPSRHGHSSYWLCS